MWIIEGQARATEDKFCIFTNPQCNVWDTVAKKFYLGELQNYLGAPENGLLEASYKAALFWIDLMEQFGTLKTEPDYGIDVMAKYFRSKIKNQANNAAKDGIGTINDMLDQKINTPRRFKIILKILPSPTMPKTWSPPLRLRMLPSIIILMKKTVGPATMAPSSARSPAHRSLEMQLVFGTVSVDAWGVRYFEL